MTVRDAPADKEYWLARYWAATTHDEEHEAYCRLRALGFPPAYGEDPDGIICPVCTPYRARDYLGIIRGLVDGL